MAQLTIQQALETAFQHHQAGRLHEAEQLYRQILAQRPEQVDALHLLGIIGGWPGALLAQRLLRHKNSKQSFQVVFWITVLLNCAGVFWLLSLSGTLMLPGPVQSLFNHQ